jgi:FMN phosphatase YigB (HAD superfamily)
MGVGPGVRAVAIDLFHTLVDPEEFRPTWFRRASAVAGLLGLPVEEFEAYWASISEQRIVTMIPTMVDRVRSYCAGRGISRPASEWAQVAELLGRYSDKAILNPGPRIVEALGRLRERGLVLGLLSNCDEREMQPWRASPLAPYFDAAVFSCELGVAKPSVEAYRALVPRWGGIPLAEAVFVGDGSNHELEGARRAGFRRSVFDGEFVSVNRLRTPEANEIFRREADASIRSLAELGTLLDA